MSVLLRSFAHLRLVAGLLLLGAHVSFGVLPGRGPEPPQHIPLGSLGWQPPTANVLAASGAFTTVHFIDEQHLLVTFNVRRLMKRLPEDPPTDTDRTIEAVVVDLRSGKVLARTNWRVHDTGQYIWALGQGRFLLRIRNSLTTFSPLAHSGGEDAFAEQPFLSTNRKIVAVLLSAERDLATVETVDPPPAVVLDDSAAPSESAAPQRTQINFYRLLQPADPLDKVVLQSAGSALARGAVNLSLTSAGYIEVLQESPSRWLFDFDSYTGKFVELSPFDTTCRPQAVFTSASEFVAFGCRGTNDRLAIGGFNMRGEQMWQQNFSDAHAFPNFAFAPANGRFALSRNIVSSTAGITVEFAPSAFTTQEIRVYQMYNGKQLLRVEASPVQRVGLNYDLSPDGVRLAVLRSEAVEVYRLPEPSREDIAAVRAARALAPEDLKVAVNLASHVRPAAAKADSIQAAGVKGQPATAPVQEAPVPVSTSAFQPAAVPAIADADAAPDSNEPRKPPTLYTLPTDKQDNPDKPRKPNQP